MISFTVDCAPAFHTSLPVRRTLKESIDEVTGVVLFAKVLFVCPSFACLKILLIGQNISHVSEARENINWNGRLALQSKGLQSPIEDKGEVILG